MKKKRYSQKLYLFFVYGTFILLLLTIFFSCFYIGYRKNVYRDSKKSSENLCASIENSISTELHNMSTISMNIAYSNVIRTNFSSFSSLSKENLSGSDLVGSRDHALAIFDAITSIIGPFQSAAQVNLYTLDGLCVGSGYLQQVEQVNLNDFTWYQPTVELNGFKYISAPEYKPYLPREGENGTSHMFISLTRMIKNQVSEADGYVEVVQDCHRLFQLVSQLMDGNPNISVFVYNSRGELSYPYRQETAPSEDYLALIDKTHQEPQNGQMVTFDNGEKHLLTYNTLEDYGWTVVVLESAASVYGPLKTFRNIFFAIVLISIIITSLLCFIISDKLTYPLRKLTNATQKITINRVMDENKAILTSADSRITELAQLCESIREMYDKLRSSTQEVLLSHSEEIQAKLQATQSLINPHFLYNSLTNLSIMAEEGMNDEIIFLCEALCDYFRYISASDQMAVPLSEELFYTQKYIDCMKTRFGDDLIYTCDITEDAKDILIPKLIIQPIVENAMKYGFNKTPPWKLDIHASVQHNKWQIEIQDNGGLLTDEKKEELLHIYQNLDKNEELKSMKIGGMGLKNVYIRMQLLYGRNAIFKIENNLPQRTIFILGGPIYKTLEEYHEHYTQI